MSFVCPHCGASSQGPDDEDEGYCAACHAWTATALYEIYSVYREPDQPLPYVLRRWALYRGLKHQVLAAEQRFATRGQAIAAIPPGRSRVPPAAEDDPRLVESWI